MICIFWIVLISKMIKKNIIDIYFNTASYLKSTRNHTASYLKNTCKHVINAANDFTVGCNTNND